MFFNERLKELRKQSPYTQKQLAEILGMEPNAYQLYEYGKREPSISKLLKLAVTLDVSLDDLLCLDDFKKSLEESSDEY